MLTISSEALPVRRVSRPPKQHRLNIAEITDCRAPSSNGSDTPLRSELFPAPKAGDAADAPSSELARLESSLTPTNAPTRISPNLYLGSHGDSQSSELLKALGIRHIVNVTDDCCDAALPGLEIGRLRIPVKDHSDASIEDHFATATQFVRLGVESAEPVLVHCQFGVSRGATIVLAYLMEYGADEGQPTRWSYESAFDYVKTRRPQVSPNMGFIMALQRLARGDDAKSRNSRRTPSDLADEVPPPFASDSDRCETDLLEDSVSVPGLAVLAPWPRLATCEGAQPMLDREESWSEVEASL